MAKAKPEQTSWLSAVQLLKDACRDDRWRMAALKHMEFWREFVVAWDGAALGLRTLGGGHVCPPSVLDFENRLAWAWEVVDEGVDAVLLMVDDRTAMCTHDVAGHFQTLQGAGLIFPDGTVHQQLKDRMNREQILHDAGISAAMHQANSVIAKRQADISRSQQEIAAAARKAGRL